MKISLDDKKIAIELIHEAVCFGTRRHKACNILEISIRTLQRWEKEGLEDKRKGPISKPKNKLSDNERKEIIKVSTTAEFCDLAPSQIVPLLADRGIYIGSESSFYRILKANRMLTHRTNCRPAKNNKPEAFVAIKPNQVWSWDITYLPTIVRGQFYYLYLILDIFSRKIVGYNIHTEESEGHASHLIMDTSLNEGIGKDVLVLHSDNGSPMKGGTMLATLQALGIMPSFSRPSVSNDNPYSESLFKTLKYRPEYPNKPFVSLENAKYWVDGFVEWYNNEHLHSSIKFVTPNYRHQNLDIKQLENRHKVYVEAKRKNPNRWSRKTRNWDRPTNVLLNPLKCKKEKNNIKQLAA